MFAIAGIFKKNIELLCWISALVALLFLNPETAHFSLCPFQNLGINFCPGCGIGHSIHYALTFDLKASFSEHPLGIPAVIILFKRVYQLIKIRNHEQKINSSYTRN